MIYGAISMMLVIDPDLTQQQIVGPLGAKFFRGLADPSRLAILQSLRAGSQTVSEIVTETGMTQPNASNHLACLLDCGLVERQRQGRYAVYSLADARIAELLQLADVILSDRAAQIAACMRYDAPEEHGNGN